MPDFGSPVAQNINVNPQQGMTTLSSLLDLQQRKQQLATGAATLQMTQQSAAQRAGIAGIDWSKYDDGTGTISTDKMLEDKDLQQRAGDQFPQILQQAASARTTQLSNKQLLVGLNDKLRDQFGSMVGALRTDQDVIADTPAGRAKVDAAISQFSAAGGPDAQRVAAIYGPVTQHAPPGKLEQGLKAIQLQAMDASAQASAQQPSYVAAGNRLEQTNPLAVGGAPSGDIRVGTGPQWIFDPVTKSYKLASATGPGGAGGPSAPAKSAAATAPGTAPTVAGMPQYAPGQADTLAANTQAGGTRYNELINAAQDSQNRVNVLDNIIRLAPQVRTGVGSGFKAGMATAVGQLPGFSGAADDAAAYNELAKFLHQSSLRAWQSAGGTGTNQQLSTIEGANPNTSQDPRTIEALARYNKAGELALQAKATAHQTWMHQPGNNFANQDQFEQQWRQNFDPILFQLKTATPQDAQRLVGKLTPEQLNELGRKQTWLKSEGVY